MPLPYRTPSFFISRQSNFLRQVPLIPAIHTKCTPGLAIRAMVACLCLTLAASSAGIIGVKGAIDADLFYQKTMPALVAQMDAQRRTVLANILQGLSQGLDLYPLQQGLRDVDSYYAAGTIPGAISGVVTDAGAKSEEADIKISRDQQFVANQGAANTIV